MNRYLEKSWFRSTVLLGALAAGFVLTQLMPAYEEMAALHEQPAAPAASRDTGVNTSSDVTGVDSDKRNLKSVRRTG